MHLRRFFIPGPVTTGAQPIEGGEYHHLKTVLRAKPGVEVELVDGQGHLGTGKIARLESRQAIVEVTRVETAPPRATGVVVACPPLKHHAMNWMVEKLCELGVDEIRPVRFLRTDGTTATDSRARWQMLAEQALKVNRRLWKTEIAPLATLDELLADVAPFPRRIAGDLAGAPWPTDRLPRPTLLLIGPPGDITAEEWRPIDAAGFTRHRLGSALLKAETAAIAAAALLIVCSN